MVHEGCPGHGLVHLLSAGAAEIGFSGTLMLWLGFGLVCLCLVSWLALFSISRLLFLMLGRNKVAADLCGRKGFRGGPLLDIHGSFAAP